MTLSGGIVEPNGLLEEGSLSYVVINVITILPDEQTA